MIWTPGEDQLTLVKYTPFKMKKKLAWLVALFILFAPLLGCSFCTGLKKNSEGYYNEHYYACGPAALEKAFLEYYGREGIAYCARRDLLSKQIQDSGMIGKEILSIFNKDAIQITWPHEIKMMIKKHGFKASSIKSLKELDPEKHIALVLVYTNLTNYHWVVFPVDNPAHYYGEGTKIHKIYLLKIK